MRKGFWKFIDDDGSFIAQDPQKISRLYFPLCNEAGLMSSISPDLNGDIKSGQNRFLTPPVTTEDLHNNRSRRNFWLNIEGRGAWSCAGNYTKKDRARIFAGPLWHKIVRENKNIGLRAEITNFIPASKDLAEVMFIEITNISKKTIKFAPTCAIPVFARSADNLRDHRHVTSLLNRIYIKKHGIVVKPVMTFDERGHSANTISYYVLGVDKNGAPPQGFFPTVSGFIGEGGNLEDPAAIMDNIKAPSGFDYSIQGKEALGGLQFKQTTLKPKKSASFILLLGIAIKEKDMDRTLQNLGSPAKVKNALSENKKYWNSISEKVDFDTGDKDFDNWMRWISLQPALRKIFGCGFLPDFDYGRGGRGWRDLWQDALALILTEPEAARELMVHNFNGVRIDGTNATIITKNNDFIADRNRISRVWMDHGVWPFFTLEYYLHQTGDFDILLRQAPYFRDPQVMRAKEIDHTWTPNCKNLHTSSGKTYHGSVLEHILLQHLVQFFNVGSHNLIRLECADWNDGLDMAAQNGESTAFSCFYAENLKKIAAMLKELEARRNIRQVAIAKELFLLLDKPRQDLNYGSAAAKHLVLNKYLRSVRTNISGKILKISIEELARDLERKSDWIRDHIRKTQWIDIDKKSGFYNGYYDNAKKRVEGIYGKKIRMMLASQAMAVLNNIATDAQVDKIAKAVDKYLKDKQYGGIRLNTDFGEPLMGLGRAFSFSYGEKENGAIFSHMNVIYANGLYRRGFAKQGNDALWALYKLAMDSGTSKIYPGIPEYFNLQGRGMYHYLTGSASWLLKTMLSSVFGLSGEYGDLLVSPRLTKNYFGNSFKAGVKADFAGKTIELTYFNPQKLDWGKYRITRILVNGQVPIKEARSKTEVLIKRSHLLELAKKSVVKIEITLG